MKKDYNKGTIWFLGILTIFISIAIFYPELLGRILGGALAVFFAYAKRHNTYKSLRLRLAEIFEIEGYYRRMSTGQEIGDMFQALKENADDKVWREIINQRIRSNIMNHALDARKFVGRLHEFAGARMFDDNFVLAAEANEYWSKAQKLAIQELDEAIGGNKDPFYALNALEKCAALSKGSPAAFIGTPEYAKVVAYFETIDPVKRKAAIINSSGHTQSQQGEWQLQTTWRLVAENLSKKFWPNEIPVPA